MTFDYKGYSTRWRKKYPERAKTMQVLALDKSRRKRFGIGNDDVIKMVKKQKGCAICHAQIPGGRKDWHVDHDHATNKTRGILCANCNLALGFFGDDIERLKSAIKYLEHHISVYDKELAICDKALSDYNLEQSVFATKNSDDIIQ